jgi:hypothetical protein
MPLQVTSEPENFSLVQNLPGNGISTFWSGKETIDPTVPAGTLDTSLVASDSGSGSGSASLGPLCKITEPANFSLVQNLPGSGIPTFWSGKASNQCDPEFVTQPENRVQVNDKGLGLVW